jgi:hypothetical protein
MPSIDSASAAIVLGASAEAHVALSLNFATAWAEWHADAALAALAGNHERAALYRAIAEIAGAVSRRRAP